MPHVKVTLWVEHWGETIAAGSHRQLPRQECKAGEELSAPVPVEVSEHCQPNLCAANGVRGVNFNKDVIYHFLNSIINLK